MTVTFENEIFYSTEKLAKILQVSPEEVTKFIIDRDFIKNDIEGLLYIQKNELNNFFELFFSSRGIKQQHYYKIPNFLLNCTSTWATTLVKMYQDNINYPFSVSPEQGEILKTLVCNINPNNLLEIGCFTGISTIWIASGLEQVGSTATVHSIDLFNEIMPWLPYRCGYLSHTLEYAQAMAVSAQLSHRIKFHKLNSQVMGRNYNEFIHEPLDFIFIDGDHSKKGCLLDFILFYPHVLVGGYIVLHDIYPSESGCYGPRYVIDKFIKKNPHFELIEIKTSPHNFGMAIIRKLSTDRKLNLAASLLKANWELFKSSPISHFFKKILIR